MDKIRVLLGNHPRMIPDALRQMVTDQDDMELVGDVRGPMRILQEIGRTKADAVILAQEGIEEPGLCSQLLAVYPDLTILSVTTDLATAFTQQLCLQRKPVETGELIGVIQSMRGAVKQPCTEE